MKSLTQIGMTFILAALLVVTSVQAQSQDPAVWIRNGDAAWNGGNTNAALQNYNYAYKLVEQWQDWSSALMLTQRYLGLGQETASLTVYRFAVSSAWNWAIDPNTLQLRPNGQQVASGEQGLAAAVNQWNNALRNMRMSSATQQWFQQAAKQASDSYQLVQQRKSGGKPQQPPPPPPQTGVTLRLSATVLAPNSTLTVYFTTPARAGHSRDWVGMFRAGDDNTKHLGGGYWGYTHGQTSGSISLQVPTTPGRYELRYLLDDGTQDIARGYFFDVR